MLGFLFGNYSGLYGAPIGPTVPSSTPTVAAGDFAILQHRVDSLELACAALWTLLKQTNGFTDDIAG